MREAPGLVCLALFLIIRPSRVSPKVRFGRPVLVGLPMGPTCILISFISALIVNDGSSVIPHISASIFLLSVFT